MPAQGLGEFLCDVFDEWIEHDVGRIFVQAIEEHVAALARHPAGVCTFAADCSSAPMVEANGDVYSCDHYAFSAYRLGNLLQAPIGDLVRSARQREFGRMKGNGLSCRLPRRLPQAPVRRRFARRDEELPLPVVPAFLFAYGAGSGPVCRVLIEPHAGLHQ